ncbi:hypothetical protein GYMC10_4382 [Paenibacillus sp. Y412MC10]|nr:hypothetical protein GYMC10_4382 [Paenibacillus sp. Y412MC10]
MQSFIREEIPQKIEVVRRAGVLSGMLAEAT